MAKVGLAKVGQDHNWPKSVEKLAKVGLAKVSQNSKTLKVAYFGQFEQVKTGLAKVGQLTLAEVGQIFLAKVGLAKVGHSQRQLVSSAFSVSLFKIFPGLDGVREVVYFGSSRKRQELPAVVQTPPSW